MLESDRHIILNSSLGLEDFSEGLESNPDDNLFINRPGAVLISYIAPSRAKLKPFSVKQMNNIWDWMTAGYTGYSDQRQCQISQLVLNLQELTTCDESESNLMSNNMGLTLMSPTNHGLKCQSQNRLQPRREIAVKNAKKEASALQLQLFSQSTVDEEKDMMTILAANK